MESEGERPVSVRRLLEQAELDLDDDDWFGDYRIVGPLGHGGMGAVFEAEAPNFGPRVALKRLLEPQLASESEERRFLFGAEAQSRLNHPHIVQVLHVGKCRGRAFFTMQLVGGGRSLRKRLEEAQRASALGRPRFDKADFRLLAKVAAGVAHAHDSGLLHRDLKPENILLEGEEPQIADFGLAKELDTDEMLTEPGWVMGTVPYMSPEQAAGRPLTQSSDLYSLGAILYEVVTGQRQFDDGERAEQRQRIASSEPVLAPRAIDPRIPEEVERVCLKCLEKDPSRRYLDASTLSRDLESLAESKPTSLPPPRGFERTVHILRRHPARVKKVLRIAIVVFTLVAAGATPWSLAPEPSARRST